MAKVGILSQPVQGCVTKSQVFTKVSKDIKNGRNIQKFFRHIGDSVPKKVGRLSQFVVKKCNHSAQIKTVDYMHDLGSRMEQSRCVLGFGQMYALELQPVANKDYSA